MAVLSYLDFFPTGVQRVAVGTAAKMCAALGLEVLKLTRTRIAKLSLNLLKLKSGQSKNINRSDII